MVDRKAVEQKPQVRRPDSPYLHLDYLQNLFFRAFEALYMERNVLVRHQTPKRAE